jgi:hypothetical protein
MPWHSLQKYLTLKRTDDAENTRISQAYLLRGAGYKGLGQTILANDDLKKAVELSVSNLWANAEFKKL